MTDLLKTVTLCITLILIAGCASREKATDNKEAAINSINTTSEGSSRLSVSSVDDMIKSLRLCDSNRVAEAIEAINTTNTSFYGLFDFGESDILGLLFQCADLPIKTEDAKSFFLTRPDYLGWISVSELDRVLTKPGLRKELAVVFFESMSIWVKEGEFFTTPREFASEIDQKLRGAGFKNVIFAYKKNHGFYRTMRVPTKKPILEGGQKRKDATINSANISGSLTSREQDWLCDSNRVAEMIKAVNSRDDSFYAKFDFGESDVLGWLFKCADVSFKTDEGEFIQLAQPEALGLIPTSELDRILVKPGLRKELAVVFVEQFQPINFRQEHNVKNEESEEGEFWGIDRSRKDPLDFLAELNQKHPEPRFDFVVELDEKLRRAGFRHVIFASKNSHGFREQFWVPTKHP